MAKYYVKHACGHEVQVELFGKTSDRENKIAWLETTLCPECYAREQAQKANKGMQIEEVEMHYSEYKNNFSNCQTLPNSYNRQTKTIIVLVPVEVEEAKEVTATEETVETIVEEVTDETLTIEEIAEICNAPVSAIRKMAEMSNEKLDEMLSQYNKTMASPNPKKLAMVDQAKKSVELVKLYKKQNNL